MRFKVVRRECPRAGLPQSLNGRAERLVSILWGLDLHVSVTGVPLSNISSSISCQRCTKSCHGAWARSIPPCETAPEEGFGRDAALLGVYRKERKKERKKKLRAERCDAVECNSASLDNITVLSIMEAGCNSGGACWGPHERKRTTGCVSGKVSFARALCLADGDSFGWPCSSFVTQGSGQTGRARRLGRGCWGRT